MLFNGRSDERVLKFIDIELFQLRKHKIDIDIKMKQLPSLKI